MYFTENNEKPELLLPQMLEDIEQEYSMLLRQAIKLFP